MSDEKDTDTITIKAPADFKEKLRQAGFLRGHTISDAGLDILQHGFDDYMRRVKPKYKPVREEAAA
jgi:hypothetical protein